jgi:hypothetical protein
MPPKLVHMHEFHALVSAKREDGTLSLHSPHHNILSALVEEMRRMGLSPPEHHAVAMLAEIPAAQDDHVENEVSADVENLMKLGDIGMDYVKNLMTSILQSYGHP